MVTNLFETLPMSKETNERQGMLTELRNQSSKEDFFYFY